MSEAAGYARLRRMVGDRIETLWMEREKGRNVSEAAYYYHTDHLGSTTLLTDSTGRVVQALSYLPYGEEWTEYNEMQRPDSLSLGQYRFNGKERDTETGFLYYGQRYYGISYIPMWLSVDPMMDKYPGISPYHYCHWNPINRVDPTGMLDDEWKIDKCGNIVERIQNDMYDQIHIVDDDGQIICSSNQYDVGTISEIVLPNSNISAFSVCGNEYADEIAVCLFDEYTIENGTPLEWGHAVLRGGAGEPNIMGTSHQEHRIGLLSVLTANGYSVAEYTHNHPSGDPRPSGSAGGNEKDFGNAQRHEQRNPGISLYTYTSKTGYSKYNSNGLQDERLESNWRNAKWRGKR